MMKLNEYLKNINKVSKVAQLPTASSSSVGELWDNLISVMQPAKDVLLQWHNVLMEYVDRPDAMFAIRGGNSAKKDEYDRLRRGFLTRTNQSYSFFYTDNFHATYFLKMALDGFVPSVDDLLETYNTRQFPARFGRDTGEERELMALPRGKDPGFQTSGYKLSHIYNVGTDYADGRRNLSLIGDIVEEYYPYGERSDWKRVEDATGAHYERMLEVAPIARPYLVAAFLRFVHPFNYFLVPKSSCADNDVSENPFLISFVKCKMKEMFGVAYDEFICRIMQPACSVEAPPHDYPLLISYSLSYNSDNGSTVKKKTVEKTERKAVTSYNGALSVGQIARTELRNLLERGVVAEQEIAKLLQKDYCRQVFGLRYAMLSKERVFQNGWRSYAAPVFIRKEKFFMTNDWYMKNLSALEMWMNSWRKK